MKQEIIQAYLNSKTTKQFVKTLSEIGVRDIDEINKIIKQLNNTPIIDFKH